MNQQQSEIDLIELLYVTVRRWKLIVLVAIPIIIAGTIFAFTRPDIYKAESILMISNGKFLNSQTLDANDLTFNQKLLLTYSEVAKSKTILKKVVSDYDLDTSIETLNKQIVITPIKETELIAFSYENKDPQMAAAVINEVTNGFIQKIKELMNFENLKIVEKAEIPDRPMPKKLSIILGGVFCLALFAGILTAFIVEFLYKKLRRPEEIEKILGCSFLGSVPDYQIKRERKKL